MRTGALFAPVVLTVLLVAGCLSDTPQGSEERQAKQVRAAQTAVPVFPGTYKFDGQFSQVLAEGIYKVLPFEEERLASDLDGVDIQLVNWRPDVPDGMRVPVIIQASPYYTDTKDVSGIGQFIVENLVPHGYVYTQLAIRSTGDSGGCDDFRGPDMVADLSQAVDWLAEQPWSNGNVSLIGISYVGTTPWYAAGSGNPHIKTIVPISGSTNAWEVYNRNGSAESRSPGIIPLYGAQAAANPERSNEHKVENFTCTSGDVYEGWAAGVYGGVTGDKDPFREFWDARNVRPSVEANYKGSVFVVHGFEDWNVDPAIVFPWSLHLNQTLGMHVKTLVGQWVHTYPDTGAPETKRWDWAEILLHWWDYWLKGIPTDLGPATQLQDNQGRWRNEATYPALDTQWRTLHLATGGELADTAGDAGSAQLVPFVADADQLRSAPGPVTFFQDFRYGPFEEELLISGLPRVHVTLVPDGPGGYVGAFLYDLDPADGTMRRIGWTDMNLRYHAGGDVPQTVTPGEPIVAKMEIQPMDAALMPGHVLVARVWVANHADRIPSLPPTAVELRWGGSTTSIVELPILERDESDYFQPPMPATE